MAQPVTRWAFPPPWVTRPATCEDLKSCTASATHTAPPAQAAPAPPATCAGPITCQTPAPLQRQQALLSLLDRDLHRGHKYLVARHFMMLEAESLPVPKTVRDRCAAMLAACSARRLGTIARQVEDWRAMIQ